MTERRTAEWWKGVGWKYVIEHWPDLIHDFAATESEVKALRRYAQHMGDCNADLGEEYPCTCGLGALVKP